MAEKFKFQPFLLYIKCMRSTIKYALASVVWFLSLGCQPTPNTFTPPPFQPDLVVDSGELEINLDRWFLPIKNSNDSYPSVCSLHLFDGSLIGSGILIRPDVVLTAGHCIDEDNIYSITIGEEEIMVKDMVIHPYYSNSFGRVRNDVGLIFLECASSYEPATIGCVDWMERYQDITTVGHSHGYKKSSRAGVFRYFGTMMSEPKSMKFIPRPIPIWFGDSGGGVFTMFQGRIYVVGIISYFRVVNGFENEMVISECSAVIIAKHLEWINKEIENERLVKQ